jgi:phage regulator Rha-like protein
VVYLLAAYHQKINNMENQSQNQLLPEVEKKIIILRNQQVILDADVAELYGVETKRINEAVSNNPEKFPDGYILELSENEKVELVENFDRFNRQKHSTAKPKAFTEKGLYMLATILKSPKAVETTIAIVEAYAKLKELSRVIVEVPQQEGNKQEQRVLLHRGGQLVEEILSDMLPKQSSETSFELNLAMFKFKHSIKRENTDEIKQLEAKVAELNKALQELKGFSTNDA